MRPLVVVLGATYDHARQYVLDNRDQVPADARLVSASCHPRTIAGMRIDRVIIAPGADLGRDYQSVLASLERSVKSTRPVTA